MLNAGQDLQNNIPEGWSYNPSAWPQRIPLLIVAACGFLIALYLGLYQLHVFSKVWEPFFGNGTKKVLTSSVSRSLPVPDGILGALGYLTDLVTGIVGKEKRWKTKPWIVIIFGFAVGPLGMISILLVILQPVLLHTWCTLCLCSAFISILMISPALDELLASLQYLKKVRKRGKPVWKAFWGEKEFENEVK